MRTLFAENILSPSPTPGPQHNPFELHFASDASNASSSSAVSGHDTPVQYSWLTEQFQNSQRPDGDYGFQGDRRTSLQHQTRRKGSPTLLFMGHRRCGKSSIRQVVFEKLPPADTLFLEPTSSVQVATLQSYVPISAAELPAHLQNHIISPDGPGDFDHAPIFSNLGSVVWVLDVQDEYHAAISSLLNTAVFLATRYPRTTMDVFIHKTDGLSDEYKQETFREVRQRVADELTDLGYGHREVSYYQTSIFDPSIFEAVSKVVQKLLPPLPAMEALLTRLCSACRVQKAYLFDTGSKLYMATDTSPPTIRDYEALSDYVDVIVDVKQLYGGWRRKAATPSRPSSSSRSLEEEAGDGGETLVAPPETSTMATPAAQDRGAFGESMVTYDKSGDTYIYAREINEHLTLMCIMGRGSSVDKRMLIDYNITVLHDALIKVLGI